MKMQGKLGGGKVSKWEPIKRPSLVAAEDKEEKGGYQCTPEELEQVYEDHSKGFFSVTRMIFKVVLIPDKNLFIILAGSMAGLPINVITGSSNSSYILFAAQLISSLLFYLSFLVFVLIVNRVREKGANFDTDGCMTVLIPQAKRNVEFAACWNEYKKIRKWFFLSLLFFVMAIILVIAGG